MDIIIFNIDRYINAAFGLAEDVEKIGELKKEHNALLLADFDDFADHLKRGIEDKSSKEKPDGHVTKPEILREMAYLEKRIKDAEIALTILSETPLKLPGFAFRRWFPFFRETCLQTDIESIQDKVKVSALPETEVYRREIDRVLANYPLTYQEQYEHGIFYIDWTVGMLSPIVRDVNTIDYIQYLQAKINEITAQPAGQESRLQWIGKPAQLGYLIGELVQKGYIDPPLHRNGEINFNELAKHVFTSIAAGTTISTLAKSLNPDSESGQIAGKSKALFTIPHIKTIS